MKKKTEFELLYTYLESVNSNFNVVNVQVNSLQDQLQDSRDDKKFWQELVSWIVIASLLMNGLSIVATCATMLSIYFMSIYIL